MNMKSILILLMPATLALTACQKSDDNKSKDPAPAAKTSAPAAPTTTEAAKDTGAPATTKPELNGLPQKEGDPKATVTAAPAPTTAAPAAPSATPPPVAAAKPTEKVAAPKAPEAAPTNSIVVPDFKVKLTPTAPVDIAPADGAAPVAEQPPADDMDVLTSFIKDQKTLLTIDSKGAKVLHQGQVETKADALKAVLASTSDVFCQTSGADVMANGDTVIPFNLADIEEKDDHTVVTSTRLMGPGRSFDLICTSKGAITPLQIQTNLKSVFDFTFKATASTPAVAAPNAAPAQPAAPSAPAAAAPKADAPADVAAEVVDTALADSMKQQTFRILDVEALTQAISKGGIGGPEKALLLGKLMDTKEAQKTVIGKKADASCQVGRVQGQLLKNKTYVAKDSAIESANSERKVLITSYRYEADTLNSVTLICFHRMDSKVQMTEIFKKILEFGVPQ